MDRLPLFHRGHHNVLAAQFREHLTPLFHVETHIPDGDIIARHSVVHLALNVAKRLQEDNELFEPLTFLDACSPDENYWPLSELWEDFING